MWFQQHWPAKIIQEKKNPRLWKIYTLTKKQMSFEALDLGFAGLGSKPPYRTSTIFNWAKLVDGGLVDRDHLSFPRPVEITRDARPGHQSHRNKTRTKNMYTKCSYWGLRFERPYRTFASLNWAPASRRWIGPDISHDHSMVPRRTYGCMLTQILELSKRKKQNQEHVPQGLLLRSQIWKAIRDFSWP